MSISPSNLPSKVTKDPENLQLNIRSWRITNGLHASLRYASQGIVYGVSSQRNLRIHILSGIATFSAGIWLNIKLELLLIVLLAVALLIVLELFNTALESMVDLAVGKNFHPLARVIKDCAAAAVLVAALNFSLVVLLIICPPLLTRIGF
uniref:Prokaryotic diacylglycerol kinase n=1 Tax=Paulinella chromatophora TaxID=39717 RepID=B1X4B5_PAUCH|nr:Prokaryotic diacylglycerol kinase [Paulinella chromatophora]ACB42784.1 Prokaryotic diacylglycerol kinase [Paulinella chromatophora]